MTKSIIFTFIEHAEHFRWALNLHDLQAQLNIFFTRLETIFAAEPFLEIDKLILLTFVIYRNLDLYFTKMF